MRKFGRKEAREWCDKALVWMDENRPDDAELKMFRAWAREALEIKAG